MNKPAVCSIGTTDPWNAAGLGLDLLALAECGVRPLGIVAGVSAQDGSGIRGLFPLSPEAIAAQFASLASVPIAAYRVGALLEARGVLAVATGLRERDAPIVYDPVFSASAGGSFVDDATIDAILFGLLPLARILTPNAVEAGRLLGTPAPATRAELGEAAQALRARGAGAVLVTGGDLPGAPLDVLADAGGVVEFEEPRIPGEMRGTGCLLAAALAAALAHGRDLRDAVADARAFVRRKLSVAERFGPFRVAY